MHQVTQILIMCLKGSVTVCNHGLYALGYFVRCHPGARVNEHWQTQSNQHSNSTCVRYFLPTSVHIPFARIFPCCYLTGSKQ